LYLHSDACQAGDYLDLHVARLGVDLMSLNGSKIYGPKQSGVLYVSRRATILPQILGGGQEMGYRSGTENVTGAIGFSVALKLAQENCKQNSYKMKRLQKIFIDEIKRLLPNALINGSMSHRLPNNVHITLPGLDNERLLYQLDEKGILAASGSACSASKQQPSHVLTALGCSDSYARSSLRFSMGRYTSSSDILKTVKVLKSLINN
jgi:cysteine desulfurase